MSYSFGCIKKCFTHKKNTRVEILNTANTNQTNYDYSSPKSDIWATVVPKTFQAAQTPLGWQSSNVTTFSMPPPKRSAPPKEGNVKHTKDMPIDSLDTMNPFVVPSPQNFNSTVSNSAPVSADISQTSSCDTAATSIGLNTITNSDSSLETMAIDFNNLPKANPTLETMSIHFNSLSKNDPAMETMSIDFNNLPKANSTMETMSIDFNNLPKANPATETMSIDFNSLPKNDPGMETMSIDFNNLPKANSTMETMSFDFNNLPKANPATETMSIDFNSLPKNDPGMETMSIDFNNLPKANPTMETMSIDFNNLPKANPAMETMSIDFNSLPKNDPGMETMSIDFNNLPQADPAMETMAIDFNSLPKADYSSETISIVPDTMKIDFNQMPTVSATPEAETMAINLNNILSGPIGAENSEVEADEQDVVDETLPEDDAYELGLASETLNIIRQSKIAIVYEDEDKDEIERKIKEEIPIIRNVNSIRVNRETRERLQEVLLRKEWPLAFVKGDVVGGLNELRALSETGVLTEWLKKHDYDLIVIGGGSGGLAAAKEAARLGKKVACLDFVKPSPQGSTWGLGGTCVNVGCIPKKLMHQASLLGHSIKDAKAFGWQIPEGQITHSWKNLKDGVQDHIASLNWGYRVQLREKMVNYINAYGSFSGPFEISATNKKGKVEKLTADRFLVATGLRPRFPEIPGAQENCITSDDLFALSYAPGKTLCVGASYVSLECAGFLKGIGFDVTVMVRSILLRGFDQDIAERIKAHMVEYGIKFERGIPSKIEEITPKTKQEAGILRVYWNTKNEEGEEVESHEDYNTVVMAIGREAAIDDVKLETLGVTRSRNGKVLGRREQSLGCPYVYAIGDVLENTPELTPVAIQAGRVLMRRLYLGSDELTEYDQIPTTVFTPLEYGCCGLSEEESYDKYGKDNIVVYHAVFNPLEYTIPERMDKDHCYCKLICVKNERDRVVGYHILTPSAGEVTQGFAIALKLGGRKRDFDRLIGIHPTIAENFTTLTLIKKEGEELKASGC